MFHLDRFLSGLVECLASSHQGGMKIFEQGDILVTRPLIQLQ